MVVFVSIRYGLRILSVNIKASSDNKIHVIPKLTLKLFFSRRRRKNFLSFDQKQTKKRLYVKYVQADLLLFRDIERDE